MPQGLLGAISGLRLHSFLKAVTWMSSLDLPTLQRPRARWRRAGDPSCPTASASWSGWSKATHRSLFTWKHAPVLMGCTRAFKKVLCKTEIHYTQCSYWNSLSTTIETRSPCGQEAASALSPVHTDRRRTAKSQNLHKGRAGPQLRVSCPHSWRCHWGIHGELQKGGTKESSDV